MDKEIPSSKVIPSEARNFLVKEYGIEFMTDAIISSLKKDIIAIGRLLWEKELVSGLNGNISARVDEERLLLTATETCLGILKEKDILLMNLEGRLLEEGQASKERILHTEVYKHLPETQAVIHTHTTYTNAYFLENDLLTPRIFETKFYIGEVMAIPQETPSVTDIHPVLEALKKNNLAVLKRHGVVAVGKNLFDCFLLIQCLEDAIKMDAISRLYQTSRHSKLSAKNLPTKSQRRKTKKYSLFSDEQIREIVRLVNADPQMQELGSKTQMTMVLAVQLEETGTLYSFKFQDGRITQVAHDNGAEFLITAPREIWRAVFNREIDPFVATTQKKMHLKGDFAKISKWYAPCSRIFELWQQVPVE